MVIRKAALALAASALLFSGCEVQSPSSSSGNTTPPPVSSAVPLFQPLKQDVAFLPFPTDLLFNGTQDGNLNLPVADPADYSDPMVALNTMSGFSTTAMLTIPFSVNLDASQDLAEGIHVFKTKNASGTGANFILMSVGESIVAQVTDGIKGFGLECDETFVGTDLSTVHSIPAPALPALQGAQGQCQAGLGAIESGTPASAEKLTFGVDYIASVSGKTVALLPLRPLDSATSYVVIVSDDVVAADGKNVKADAQYIDARAGNLSTLGGKEGALYKQINASEGLAALATAGDLVPGDEGNIALSYTVTTQNIVAPLLQAQVATATAALTAADAYSADPKPETQAALVSVGVAPLDPVNNGLVAGGLGLTADVGAGEEALVQVYAGKVSNLPSFLDTVDPVHSVWNNAGKSLSVANQFAPEIAGKVDVPVLVIAPTAAGDTVFSCTPADRKLVIFQHGITSNRGTLLALAPALTKICAVGVAIDLPGHGIMASDELAGLPLGILAGGFDTVFGVSERLVEKGAGPAGACMQGTPLAAAADGRDTCGSGDSFVNLTNLANARDTLRQSVVDLNSLYFALQTAGIVEMGDTGGGVMGPVGAVVFDKAATSFVGMSLGAIVGGTFAATLENFQAVTAQGSSGAVMLPPLATVTLNVGGGGIAKLLDGSPAFEPVVTAGLAAQGVTKPSSTYESFLLAAQTVIDSADPINYVNVDYSRLNPALSADAGLNVLKDSTPILFQEVVGDGVVPNNVYGNGPLAQAWGLVSGGGQSDWLAGQNPMTTPSAFGGTDSLVQGTAFLSLAQAGAAAQQGLPDPTTAGVVGACLASDGALCDLGMGAFFGIGLEQVDAAGGSGSSLVRFALGNHGSLLNPSVDPSNPATLENAKATGVMQTQVATFIASDGALVAGEAAADSACQALTGGALSNCADAIAEW